MAKKTTWAYNPKPVKLDEFSRNVLLSRTKKFVASSKQLEPIVNRVVIRAGRIYVYHLVEAFIPEGGEAHFIKPLIDGKYNEFPFARITLFDKKGDRCTLDWQRHNGQWATILEDSLDECLKFIQDDESWFQKAY